MAIICFTRQLVYKVPLDIEITETINPHYETRLLSLDDVENDEWLRKDKKALIRLIKIGHIGIVIFDKKNKKVAARSFIALNRKSPNHIPKIPKNSAWLHCAAVKEEYRGHGLQNSLTMFAVQTIRKTVTDIFTDTTKDNIPSRINQKKLGLIEYGVYSVLKIGTQRLPLGYVKLEFWNKKIKHPDIDISVMKHL